MRVPVIAFEPRGYSLRLHERLKGAQVFALERRGVFYSSCGAF
jgi:hypothetical protein